jgi:imidazolonepropionase-like amidohydrolase
MRFKPVAIAAAIMVASVFQSPAWADTPVITAYMGVTLIDGTGAPAQADMAILVADGRITAVQPTSSLPAALPESTKVVDATGWYALPGLIDTHVHMATVPNFRQAHALMRRYLYSGITTIRDMAGDARALSELARESRLKKIPAPDLYYAALMAGPTFFHDPRPGAAAEGEVAGQVPWMQAITPDTDFREAVTLARGTSATGIKIYANLEAPEVKHITAEAHRQGIKVWAHSMVFPATPADVVDAGVDVISHVCRLAWEIAPEKPREYHHTASLPYETLDPADPRLMALFGQMKEQGTILDATLWLYTHLEDRRKGQDTAKKAGPAICPPAFAGNLTAAAHAAGVDIATGTDVTLPAEADYPALHNELETLVSDAAMAPLDVIRSATLVGARTLGLEAEKGSVEVGKKADIVFVAADPLADIHNLRKVVLTLKGGTLYARADYVPVTANELADGR